MSIPEMARQQRYVTSELTHFVGARRTTPDEQYRLLVQILKSGILLSPGLSGPVVQRGKDGRATTTMKRTLSVHFTEPLSSNNKYRASIVCFADIPLEDLPLHMAKYSPFGLSFLRDFLLRQGANPVFYVARQALVPSAWPTTLAPNMVPLASVYDEGSLAVDAAIPSSFRAQGAQRPSDAERANSFLSNHLFPFLKFFDASLPEEHPDNYYMEREWRVVGSVQFTVNDVERVLLPRAFASRFRLDVPEYPGQVSYT